MDLLAAREPNAALLSEARLSAGQEQRLRLVADLKSYGMRIGLAATDNYDTVAWPYDRPLENLSACAPLSFEAKTWTFPIVGEVPYLGFFTDRDRERQREKLLKDGYEVYTRGIGAYSTLGWFRDPLLPDMLAWSEEDLSETLFHELSHATLWVPGSVDFNESFASYLGEYAGESYLEDRYGAEAPITTQRKILNEDYRRWQAVLHTLYEDLDAMYKDPTLSAEEKTVRKASLYDSLKDRIQQSDIVLKDRFIWAADHGTWNNARMIQYKAYNTDHWLFAALMAKTPHDIPAFIENIRQITLHQKQPFEALRVAVSDKNVQSP